MTGLKDFGVYLSKLLTVDALFLNEDRHMHNIAVLRDKSGEYHYCPIFDNGCALLSDTTIDYPVNEDVINLIPQVRAKTLSQDFNEQLEAVEKLYGQNLKFYYDQHLITELLEEEHYYPAEIKTEFVTFCFSRGGHISIYSGSMYGLTIIRNHNILLIIRIRIIL